MKNPEHIPKQLKPLKIDSPEKFREVFLHKLWDELYWANFHYEILEELSRLCEEHSEQRICLPFSGIILYGRIIRQRWFICTDLRPKQGKF